MFDALLYSQKSICNFVLVRKKRKIKPSRTIFNPYYYSYKKGISIYDDIIQYESEPLRKESKVTSRIDFAKRCKELLNDDDHLERLTFPYPPFPKE